MMDNCVAYKDCIYIDESGFNLWLKRSYGRSNAGERCFRTQHGRRGKNISLCMAISVDGIVHHQIRQGAFNNNKFNDFLCELDALLGEERAFLIMDNCRIHYGLRGLSEQH